MSPDRKGQGEAMQRIMLDAEAGQVSAELVQRGIAAETRVHVLVDVIADEPEPIPLAAMNQGGGAFEWLNDEPDLYFDADLIAPRS